MTIKSLIITLLLLFACQKNNLGELLKKSENYAEGGNLKKALSLAMEAYDMNPENDRVKIALSKIYATEAKDHVENADCDSATRSANRSLDFYSDNDSAYNTLAVCAVVEKNFAKCIIYANKQLALEKQYKNVAYSVHHNLSVCYRELKKYNEAVSHYIESLKYTPSTRNMLLDDLFSLGKISFIKGRPKDSNKYLAQFINEYEKNEDQETLSEYSFQYREAKAMLIRIEMGDILKYSKGKEPAYTENILNVK